jgi:hypothetical protein
MVNNVKMPNGPIFTCLQFGQENFARSFPSQKRDSSEYGHQMMFDRYRIHFSCLFSDQSSKMVTRWRPYTAETISPVFLKIRAYFVRQYLVRKKS